MNGFDVCRQIKDNPSTAHIPIVMLTAFSIEQAREKSFAAGADQFVEKPFRIDALLAVTRLALSSTAAQTAALAKTA